MSDKITKSLQKLTKTEQQQVKLLLTKIKNDDLLGLNIVKLKSRNDIFRVRKGRFRIIFRKATHEIEILAIERRSEKTYRDF